ncbi:MAG: type II toxin-antitoxin system death-on-curing family toxin [Acidimicrobiia bacterium]
MERTYLTVVELLAVHRQIIDEFGGSKGVRDMGALEAAVFRPQTGYYDDAIAEAAALMESLILIHPLVDGNKRVGLAAADIHLRLNDWMLLGDTESMADEIITRLANGTFERAWLDSCLRSRCEER